MNPQTTIIEVTWTPNGEGPPLSGIPAALDEWLRYPRASRFVLHGLNWAAYKAISAALERRHLRLTYYQGTLELMTKSSTHGTCGRLFCYLVGILAKETGTPRRSCGDMTSENEDQDHGVEPDECFYL